MITHELQESESRTWVEGAEDDVRIEPIGRPQNACKTRERKIVDELDCAKRYKMTKIVELAMKTNAKDMLTFSAREPADSRGERISCLDTPDSPARADPQLERMVLKGEEVYETTKMG